MEIELPLMTDEDLELLGITREDWEKAQAIAADALAEWKAAGMPISDEARELVARMGGTVEETCPHGIPLTELCRACFDYEAATA